MLKKLSSVFLGSILVLMTGCPKNPVSLKPIELLQPTIGQTYHCGQTREIKWRINDKVKIDAIGVKLSLDSGITFPISIGNAPISSSDTVIVWEILKTQVSTLCVIEVFKYSDEAAYNEKSGTFKVDSVPLVLLNPLGGAKFKVGEAVQIKWSVQDQNQIGSVGIGYSLNGGKTWDPNGIGAGSFTYPDTSYIWTPTAAQKSNMFVLKVYSYTDRAVLDKSAPFAVTQ
jgi:hypothetical protein